jgi:hypothetical protein
MLKGTSNNSKFVTPAPYQVRGKLRRGSSHINTFWIPAGVYPDKNRGLNDISRGTLIELKKKVFKPILDNVT